MSGRPELLAQAAGLMTALGEKIVTRYMEEWGHDWEDPAERAEARADLLDPVNQVMCVRAIARASEADRAKLAHVFPREVLAWELWQAAAEPPTAGELAELLDQEMAAAAADANCVVFEGGMLIRDTPAPGVSG